MQIREQGKKLQFIRSTYQPELKRSTSQLVATCSKYASALPADEAALAADYAAAYAAEQANWPARSLDAAILLVLGELWRNRESGTADPLSPSVKRILDLFKRPQYA